MMNSTKIIINVFDKLIVQPYLFNQEINFELKLPDHILTKQDDPFDEWVYDSLLRENISERVCRAGKLQCPDIVLINDSEKTLVGLEVKKLDANSQGNDPRGLTLDYNSTIPCGITNVNYENNDLKIPNYYLFALLKNNCIITSVICHGNFLNCDYELHLESKISNNSTYSHGSYSEGSIRHRKMYTFPNPLNSKLSVFSKKHCLVVPIEEKTVLQEYNKSRKFKIRNCVRESLKFGNQEFIIIYINNETIPEEIMIRDIFADCKKRTAKDRVPYTVKIPNQ